MRGLAERIAYSANFAYRYFSGRDDILLALVRDGFDRLRSAVVAQAQGERQEKGDAAAVHRAAHAYLDFALSEPELYQLMYGLGGVRVSAVDAWDEGQAVGNVLAGLLHEAGDTQAEKHVVQLWATAHGLMALQVVGRVDVDPAGLHALLDDTITDVLTRALSPITPAIEKEQR
jgi:AcrR family transcriptional regulator